MALKYGVGRTFLECWLKNKNICENKHNLKRFELLKNKRVRFFDEFITENV